MNAPSLSIKPAGEKNRFTCAAFACDEETVAALRGVLAEHGWPVDRVVHGGIDVAVKQLAVEASPDFLIIDLSMSMDVRADIGSLAEVCEPGIIVLALGTINDVTLYRDLLGSGIQDYLLKPVNPELLREAVVAAEMALSNVEAAEERDPTEHKVCGVIGVRGGVGASTIASSCAWLLANDQKLRVALLDLDIHYGTDAMAFDLEPGRGLVDALESPSRVDSLFIERATIKEGERLSILGSEAPITEPLVTDPSALSHLQGELRAGFDAVVVDMPRSMLPSHQFIVQQMTDVIVVADLSLAAARDTIRVLGYLKTHAPDAKVRLVVNKVPKSSQLVEVSKKDFEASVEQKIDLVLPADVKNTVLAAKKGRSLPQVAAGARLTAQIRALSREIGGEIATDKTGFWAKINAVLPKGKKKSVPKTKTKK